MRKILLSLTRSAPVCRVRQFGKLLPIVTIAVIASVSSTGANAYQTTIFHAEAVNISIPAMVGYVAPVFIEFDAFNRRFELELMSDDALLEDMDNTDTAGISLYRGRVVGVDNSWVRITSINGKLSGVVHDGYELFMIDQVVNLANTVSPAIYDELKANGAGSAMFRAEDVVTTAMCGTGHMQSRITTEDESLGDVVRELEHMGSALAVPDKSITVKAVYDESVKQFAELNGSTAEQQVIAQMYIVDGIYSNQVGVKILQTPAVQYRDTDTGRIDPVDLLFQFQDYIVETGNEGVAHLFTGREMGVAGIAVKIGGMCSNDGVAVSTIGQNRAVPVGAIIVAHEIGHNFGAPHDNEQGSVCELTPSGFVMSPSLSNGGDTFSECSLTQIENTIASEGTCLEPYVDDGNSAPVLEPIELQINNIGDTVSVTLSATDADNDELSFFAPRLPEGLSLSEDGIITGTLLVDRYFVRDLIIVVSDGKAGDSQSFSWYIYDPEKIYIDFDAAVTEVSEGDDSANVEISLSRASDRTVIASIVTQEGTATPGQDYFGFASDLEFAPGETSKTVRVQIVDDAEQEQDETMELVIGFITGGAVRRATYSTEIRILDNDTDDGDPAAFSVSSSMVNENDGMAEIAVSLDRALPAAASVSVATMSDTARAGSDFYGVYTVLDFEPGETTKKIPVQILNDSEIENDEVINVRLFDPSSNALLGTATGTIIIKDADDESAAFSVSAGDVNEDTGSTEVTVSLSSALSTEADVSIATEPGSATRGADYYGVFSELAFAPGETSKKVTVQILNDSEIEDDETINVRILKVSGNTTIGTGSDTITIKDDDGGGQ